MKLSDRTDLPHVEEWITISDAAAMLRLSRQNVHVMAQNNKFSTLARLGDVQPVFVVKRAEVQEMVERKTKNTVATEA